MSKLKLYALDQEDLDVLSAHLQDAVLRIRDMAYLPDQRRFALVVNRFDWADQAEKAEEKHRRRAALHFERVNAVRRRKLRQDSPDGVLNLLAIRFSESEAPAGTIDLVFSADAAIRLEVECLEASLSDLGPAWSTEAVPAHDLSGPDAGAPHGNTGADTGDGA